MKQTQYIVTLHQADDAPEPSLKNIERVLTSRAYLYSQVGTTLEISRVGSPQSIGPTIIDPPPPTWFTVESIIVFPEIPEDP